ncbi:MAG: hypothetical protein ACREKH_08985, partial [Candidatus Rokuibacteriota bacterium]
YVRLEIAAALSRKIRVVPVLVQRADMPKASELPPDLTELAQRNAVEIRDTRFEPDVGFLVDKLAGWRGILRRSRRPAALVAGTLAVVAVAVFGLLTLVPPKPVATTLEPVEVEASLRVHPDPKFGAIDRSAPVLLGHIAPKNRINKELHYLVTRSLEPPFEYSGSLWLPGVKGQPYVGRLERVIERGVLSEVELARVRKLAAMEICLEQTADKPGPPVAPIGLECKEGESCRLTGPARVKRCEDKASIDGTWITLAHAQDKEERRWLVPSLSTLRRLKGTPKATGYTEFSITSGPLDLANVNGLGWAIGVNGTPVHIDGWPPEAHRDAFDPRKGLQIEFGLENLDFSGKQSGVEHVDVTLE